MAQSNLLRLGVGLGVIGLLLVGGAYLAFTDAFETYEDTEWESADDCALTHEIFWCWIPIPSNDLGCFSCLFGIFMVVLVVGILFYGSIFGVVGATLNVSNTDVGVVSLPPPKPPGDLVVDEFADLELELEDFE